MVFFYIEAKRNVECVYILGFTDIRKSEIFEDCYKLSIALLNIVRTSRGGTGKRKPKYIG